MEGIRYIEGEWAVISQAPFTFVIVFVLLGGAIWAAAHFLYGRELATKNATIEFLREQLVYKASDDPVTPPATPPASKPEAKAPPTHPDAIYQRGHIVGRVVAPRVDMSQGTVTFEAVTDTANLDRGSSFVYRDHVLKITAIEQSIGMKVVSGSRGSVTFRDVIEGVTCQIL